MNTNDPAGVIRISRDDALNPHVDDMLKRQMSMRGDPGVTRDRNRAWYYQNWFILGVVGMLGALVAWAILEPMFADYLYFQGKITAVSESANLPEHSRSRGNHTDLEDESVGSVVVNGETILLLSETKEIKPDKRVGLLEPGTLKEGEEAGFYVRYFERYDEHFAVAGFVVKSPPPLPLNKPQRSLHQLETSKSAVGLLLFPLVAGFIADPRKACPSTPSSVTNRSRASALLPENCPEWAP